MAEFIILVGEIGFALNTQNLLPGPPCEWLITSFLVGVTILGVGYRQINKPKKDTGRY